MKFTLECAKQKAVGAASVHYGERLHQAAALRANLWSATLNPRSSRESGRYRLSTDKDWRPAMARIFIHRSHPDNAEHPVTGFTFTIEYNEGKQVRFADLAIPPSSDANSLGAFRQELRRLANAILDVADSGRDINWDPPAE
jgi:hypothetical protein